MGNTTTITVTKGSRAARVVAPGAMVTLGGRRRSATIAVQASGGNTTVINARAGNGASIAMRPVHLATMVTREGRIRVTVGKQGPAGISGVDGAGTFTAGETIAGHRFIRFNDDGEMVLASSDDGPAAGLVRDAVAAGATTRVYKDASVNGFSGLEPGKRYFLSATGGLTKTAPATGIIQTVGTAATETILIVEIGEPAYQ